MSAGTFVGGEPGSSAGTPGDMNGPIRGAPGSSSGDPQNQSLVGFLAMLDRRANCGHGTGSGVLILFPTSDELDIAQWRLKALKKSFVEGSTTYLNVNRTEAQQAPSRVLRRLHQELERRG